MLSALLEGTHRIQRGAAKAECGAWMDLDDSYLHMIECAEQPRDTQTAQREVRHAIEGRRHDGAMPHPALDDALPQ